MFQRLLILLMLCAPGLQAQTLQEEFALLLQNWNGEYGPGVHWETWTALHDDALEGVAYYLVGEDTVVHEYLQIRKIGSHLGYFASVNGAPPVLFNLTSNTPGNWIFENPEHDFPQKIHYSIVSEGQLKVVVSGMDKEKSRQDIYWLQAIDSLDEP